MTPDAPHSKDAPSHRANHLIDSTSPYLLQHAYNPVEWFPWGAQALDKARREDKPIFLSIGYSACHWCHVMEREVFENPDIATLMNEHFVNIKVDREERPDLDELYMLATQIMSGSGGWPMSVWLTPDLEPFYAGTYFPPVDSYGRPGFPKLELAIADAWKNRRPDLLAQSQKVVDAIRQHADESAAAATDHGINLKTWFDAALEQYADKFDPENGGLGGAPKFPPHQALHLWLAMLRHPNAAQLPPARLEPLREMTTKTLDGMMHGGIHDHVAGGFARYSTDDHWLVPHFEKMLYDNAQLAPAYAHAAIQFQRPDYARVARRSLDFWLREMSASPAPDSPTGAGFFSALDADSEGQEGKYYVWTPADIHAAIPNPQDAAFILDHFHITPHGNWDESPIKNATVLATFPIKNQESEIKNEPPLDALLLQLRTHRAHRPPPALDDKILTSWNGLMISALAITGRLLHEPRYLEAAHRAIGYLLTHHMQVGGGGQRLLRVSRHGKAHIPAFLEDHAFLLNGLMDLVDSTMPTSLPGTMARKRALELADTMIRDFADSERGGFHFTGGQHEPLFARMKNAADNATPSANAMAIRALLRLARSSGKEHYHEVAMQAVRAFAGNIDRRPDFFPTILQSLLEDAQANSLPGAQRDLAIALEATTPAQPAAHFTLSVTPPPPLSVPTFQLELHLAIAQGFHIQSHRPADKERFATIARLRGEFPLASQEWSYPPLQGEGYAGQVTFRARCRLPENLAAGRYLFRATLLAQPCTDIACHPPEKATIDFPLIILPH